MLFKEKDEGHAAGIAVIGLAARFPGASRYDQLWDTVITGQHHIGEIPAERWSQERYYHPDKKQEGKSVSKWIGSLDNIYEFDHLFFHMSPNEAAAMDPQQRLLLQETWHCMEDAGIGLKELQQSTTAVYTGTMATDFASLHVDGEANDKYRAIGSYESFLANRISHFYDLKGLSLPVNAACSSSLVALHLAAEALRRRECDYALVGAVNLNLDPMKYVAFSNMGLLSPQGECRSFQENANGYVPADGVGVMLLRRLDEAVQDQNHIHAVIRGSAVTHGGSTRSILVPNAEAQQRCMVKAHEQSGIPVDSVNYIEAHGTGTYTGDSTEIAALSSFYREHTDKLQFCRLGTLKPLIGHTEAASGMAGLIKMILMMKHRQLPALPDFTDPNQMMDKATSPFEISAVNKEWRPEPGYSQLRAGIHTYSMGGVNAYVLLEEYDAKRTRSGRQQSSGGQQHPFALSCRSLGDLSQLIADWQTFTESETFVDMKLEDCCKMLISTRNEFNCRYGVMIGSKEELKRSLAAFVAAPYEQAEAVDKLRVLHLGEAGWITDSRFREWIENTAVMKSVWSDISQELKGTSWWSRMRDRVKGSSRQPDRVQSFLQHYGCAVSLLKLGFKPDALSGTGVGRWAALALSGAMSLRDVVDIISEGWKHQSATQSLRLPLPLQIPWYDDKNGSLISQLTSDNLEQLIDEDGQEHPAKQRMNDLDHHRRFKCYSWPSSSDLTETSARPDNEFLKLLLSLWMDKVEIEWELVYPQRTFKTVAQLPGYPFARYTHRNGANHVPTKSNAIPVNREYDLAQGSAAEGAVQDVQSTLVRMFCQLIDIDQAAAGKDMDIRHYGADSDLLGEFAQQISTVFQLDFNSARLFDYPVLSALAVYLAAKARQAGTPDRSNELSGYDHEAAADPRTQDIAIIGLSCRFPQSNSAEEFWEHLLHNDDLITPVPQERWDWMAYAGDPLGDANKTNSRWGGFLDNIRRFDAELFRISRVEAELMDPQQRLMLEEAWHAIEDAGYRPFSLSGRQIGVFVAAFNNDYNDLLHTTENPRWDGYSSTGTYASMIPNRISYVMNLHGPSVAVDTACSGSLVAIHQAVAAIRDGDCEQALAGGVNLLCSPRRHLSFGNAGMLAGDGRCKTFDTAAN